MFKIAERDEGKSDRRNFLKMVGVAGAASAVSVVGGPSAVAMNMPAGAATQHEPTVSAVDAAVNAGYEFFNPNELAFIEAAVDTLIPTDSVGPGAKELGVATYIDRQMAGSYGKGDRLYLDGPFSEGTPQQGYQLAMTPSEVIRNGIADISTHVQKDTRRPSMDFQSRTGLRF